MFIEFGLSHFRYFYFQFQRVYSQSLVHISTIRRVITTPNQSKLNTTVLIDVELQFHSEDIM